MDLDKLRKLNFEKLISIDTPDVSSYSFDDYRKNGFEHKPITGYCVSCENQGCNFGKDDESFQLTNISHGAHSSDFFQALKSSGDIKGWHNQPVMFVYESPSLDYGIYKKVVFQGLRKRPSKDWYWIHEEGEILSYPERFKGGEYGDFVLSAIQTFRLSNVYITNLVKCGLNNREGKFKGLASFRNETIGNCYEQFLEKEISIFKPEVIFAVGSGVEDWLTWFVKDSYYVQQLPHPAGRRRGFRDEHYKAIYFWVVARALHKSGIIETLEGMELAKIFLEKYDD